MFAAAVLIATSAAAQPRPPLSYEWAEDASPKAAGQRLLGPLATLYPNYGDHSYSPFGGQWSVAVASQARSSGMEGMCEADVLHLQFVYQRRAAEVEEEPENGSPEPAPSVLRSISTDTRYRAIADTAPQAWTEEYEAEIDAACAGETDGWAFGRANGAVDAWYAVRLQTLLPDMAANEPAALLALLKSCVGEKCATPLALFAQLRQAKFWSGDVEPCDALVDVYQPPRFRGPFCLKARYLLSEIANVYEYLVVTARFEEVLNANQDLVDPRLMEISLKRDGLIED